jgi:hypothetical protein
MKTQTHYTDARGQHELPAGMQNRDIQPGDILAADPDAQDLAMRETFFGPTAVPVDAETLLSAAVRLIERRGFEVKEAQRASLRSIFDAYVAKRDGLSPRIGAASSRLQELAQSLTGNGVTN